MTVLTAFPLLQPQVRRVSDARPPGLTWARVMPPRMPTQPPAHEQPPLVFDPRGELVGRPRPSGSRVLVVAPAEDPLAPGLPDARSWSAALALALAEALQGRRPVGQLSRWVDERVLATITVAVRQQRHPRRQAATAAPARLHSVHLQYPVPDAVEVSAHVRLAEHSSAIAFRLTAWYDRWLCTELELAPRHCVL